MVTSLEEVLVLESALTGWVGLSPLGGEVLLWEELLSGELLLGVAGGETDTGEGGVVGECVHLLTTDECWVIDGGSLGSARWDGKWVLVGHAGVDDLGVDVDGISGGWHTVGGSLTDHALTRGEVGDRATLTTGGGVNNGWGIHAGETRWGLTGGCGDSAILDRDLRALDGASVINERWLEIVCKE